MNTLTIHTKDKAKQAALKLSSYMLEKGYSFTELYEYKRPKGNIIYYRIRLDHPTEEKWIRPLSLNGNGWELKEPPFPGKKPLYRLPEIHGNSTDPVYVVEGEKCTDLLFRMGFVATTSGPSSSAKRADWAPLANKKIIIWPDNDGPGMKYAQNVAEILSKLNCEVDLIAINELGLPDGGDCDDWLDNNPGSSKENIERFSTCKPILWNEAEQIKTELFPVAPFELDMLPDAFREWISDVSLRMQCPPDFIAAAAITMLGSLIGTRCSIRPKQFDDDWVVIPNLWGGIVGCPSTLKTPALQEATKPLSGLETKAKELFDSQLSAHDMDKAVFEAQRDSLKAEMKKSADPSKKSRSLDEIKNDWEILQEPEEPKMRRYKSNDATVEKLSELLNENPHGLLLFRDELVGLLATWEKPGRESDRAFFLEAWNGMGSHTTDRIGRGTIFTPVICLSLFGGIQPSKLTGYLYQIQNGLDNDGLTQRLQLLVFPDEIKKWELIDQKPDQLARDRAFKVIEQLAQVDFDNIGAGIDFSNQFSFFRFSSDAQQIFNAWLTDLELNKLRIDDHPLILEHLGKYRSLMPTLALIFHLIDVVDGGTQGPVSPEATEKAVAWCKYLETHARRVYGLVADLGQQAALKLAEKIKEGKLSNGFTVRDIYRQNWTLLNDKDIAREACVELLEAGWLKEKITEPSFGQKGKIEYRINPKIFDNP
jgi:hypothetical protein